MVCRVPAVHVLIKTRYVEEVKPLYPAGADDVIPEEFETSVEILVRVLRRYLIPQLEIQEFVGEVRSGAYDMFRDLSTGAAASTRDLGFRLPDSGGATVRVGPGSFLVGRTLAEVALRTEYGVTLLAVQRERETITNPRASSAFRSGDRLIVFGPPQSVADAGARTRGGESWEE